MTADVNTRLLGAKMLVGDSVLVSVVGTSVLAGVGMSVLLASVLEGIGSSVLLASVLADIGSSVVVSFEHTTLPCGSTVDT